MRPKLDQFGRWRQRFGRLRTNLDDFVRSWANSTKLSRLGPSVGQIWSIWARWPWCLMASLRRTAHENWVEYSNRERTTARSKIPRCLLCSVAQERCFLNLAGHVAMWLVWMTCARSAKSCMVATSENGGFIRLSSEIVVTPGPRFVTGGEAFGPVSASTSHTTGGRLLLATMGWRQVVLGACL